MLKLVSTAPAAPAQRPAPADQAPAPVDSAAPADQPFVRVDSAGRFCPKAGATIRDTGLTGALVESLVFKTLLANGTMTSRDVARATALPGKPVAEMLASMKMRQLAH